MSTEQYDWIFDYVIQFLESDEFDSLIMDFVDEKCEVFDNNEENKFIYSDIHKEFTEYLELLISSNLSELGITMDMFVEACEKSRNSRDINQLVFERLCAIDDFVTFKRMMVKRNIELQVEALKSYQKYKNSLKYNKSSDQYDDDVDDEELTKAMNESLNISSDSLPDPELLKAIKENELDELKQREAIMEEEMEEILQSSLMEMELLHRQEELEQADLEAALAMSLLLEEERINLIREEIKNQPIDKEDINNELNYNYAEAKNIEKNNNFLSKDTKYNKEIDISNDMKSNNKPIKIKPINNNNILFNIPDPKPLLLRNEYKPLPGINELNNDLKDRIKLTEETIQKNYELNKNKKNLEENLKNSIKQEDIEERAKYMKQQRDKIIQLKKLEREKKLLNIKEKNNEKYDEKLPFTINDFKNVQNENVQNNNIDDEISNEKRSIMRLALAKKLKKDLIDNEDNKIKLLYDNSFIELDKQLKQVENLRNNNQQREIILADQLKRQQITMAKNVKISALKLKENS